MGPAYCARFAGCPAPPSSTLLIIHNRACIHGGFNADGSRSGKHNPATRPNSSKEAVKARVLAAAIATSTSTRTPHRQPLLTARITQHRHQHQHPHPHQQQLLTERMNQEYSVSMLTTWTELSAVAGMRPFLVSGQPLLIKAAMHCSWRTEATG